MVYRPQQHWGAHFWAYLHTLTIVDTDEPAIQIRDSEHVIEILREIHRVIPCHKCAAHFQTFFQTEIEGRDRVHKMELFDLLVEYHNQINQRLGKSIMSIEEARLKWAKTI
jgi:hypothetical protein